MHAPLSGNIWTENALLLADAYVRNASPFRFWIATATLQDVIGDEPIRVLDAGGGYGEQAVLLARLGHQVDIVDPDPNMLAVAHGRIGKEPADVSGRIQLIKGHCETLSQHVGDRYDLVCCHSVLAYLPEIEGVLDQLVACCDDGGWLSIINRNPAAEAMRYGLQQNWPATLAALSGESSASSTTIPDHDYSREWVSELLIRRGCEMHAWSGLGIFTDHCSFAPEEAEFEDALAAEFTAGQQDPYRQIARAYHIISKRVGE